MRLRNVQVANFKCIRNPCQFDVSEITCLIGKNESGKTAILEALYRLNPLIPRDGLFNLDDDFPRIDVEDYRLDVGEGRRQAAIVTRAFFLLDDADLRELEADFPGVLARPELVLSKGYANELYAELVIDEAKAVAALLGRAQLGAAQLKTLAKCSTLPELTETLKPLSGDKKAASLLSLLAEIQAKGLLDHIYRKYLEARVPKMLYFDDFYNMQGHANLQALAERRKQDRLLESDYPLLGLIDLARLNLEDIDNPARAVERDNRLEGASNHLTKRLMRYWSQNSSLEMRFDIRPGLPGDPEGMQSGTNLWGHVYNSRQKVRTLLGRRSRGFVWFFSFLAWFSREKRREIPIILLLDEPALYLHGSAQRDLLRFFEDEAATGHQVLYSSQSPYMVDAGHLERVRIVEDRGAEATPAALASGAGTQVFAEPPAADPESQLTLRGALAQKLFTDLCPGEHPLLIDSVADLVFLQSMSSLLASLKREALDPRWLLTPVGGARNLLLAASMLGAAVGRGAAALLSTPNSQPQDLAAELQQSALRQNRVLFYHEFTGSSEADVEDMFEVDFYLDLFNGSYRDSLGKPLAKGQLRGRGARIATLVPNALPAASSARIGGFERIRPAAYFAANSTKLKEGLSKETWDRFERVFKTLNALLREPAA
jgi:predicted ATPase